MRILRSISLLALVCGWTVAAAGAEVASSDGVTIVYETHGRGEPALVFVHGWSCDRTYWNRQLPDFSDTHTVVTVDLAGHGESGLDREKWTIAAYAQDVVAVVRELDAPQVILVGHSMSGPITVEAAALLPERVIGVIGIDTLHDMGGSYSAEQIEGFVAPMRENFAASADGFVRSMFPEDADPQLVDLIARDMASAPQEVAVSTIAALLGHSVAPALEKLDAPIRCLNSDQWPMNLDGNRALYADYEVVTMEGVGHFPFAEKAAIFNGKLAEIIRSLER